MTEQTNEAPKTNEAEDKRTGLEKALGGMTPEQFGQAAAAFETEREKRADPFKDISSMSDEAVRQLVRKHCGFNPSF